MSDQITKYELRTFNFLVDIPGLDSMSVMKADLPTLVVEYDGERAQPYALRAVREFGVTWRLMKEPDDVRPSLDAWIAAGDPRTAVISLLESDGTVYERWTFDGTRPEHIGFSTFDYAANGIAYTVVDFTFETVTVVREGRPAPVFVDKFS